jgi:hypothetical protein
MRSATSTPTPSGVESFTRTKRFENLRARAAFFFGASWWRGTNDHGGELFVMSKGAVTREFASLDAAEEFLDSAQAD